MVVNVSGRTDIVAFYMKWFMNRLEDGYFLIRNPFYNNLVHRIDCDDIDMFVFCTKNPENLLKNIDRIYKPFIVHITITPYGRDFEPNVPNKTLIIENVKRLSRIIGKDRIFIRYDPIILNDKYDVDFHVEAFRNIVEMLSGYTNTIIVSFVDEYKNVTKNKETLNNREPNEDDLATIGENFAFIASENGMTVQTCGEVNTLFEYGFIREDCVTSELVESFTGKVIKEKWGARKEKNCNCIHMYDIGAYNSCKHYCKYCYANYSERDIEKNCKNHDEFSPLLLGQLKDTDIVKNIKNKE